MDPERRVVLITGAGASRRLGKDEEMPLMIEWGASLEKALDAAENGLAQACGLTNPSETEAFERSLGDLLTWGRGIPLDERFLPLTGSRPGAVVSQVQKGLENTKKRWPVIIETINRTLFDQFGLHRVDSDRARETYNCLMDALNASPSGEGLFAATTNYDPSMGVALDRLNNGAGAELGFRGPTFGTRRLAYDLFEPWEGPATPVLHLHGAVGWYRDDESGQIEFHPADQQFDNRRTPVVLYPDPDKDPFNEVGVSALWDALRRALETATHVLIIGHSLHDKPLLEVVGRAAKTRTKLAVTFYDDNEREEMEDRARLQPLLARTSQNGGPSFLYCDFGPAGDFTHIANWLRVNPR